MRKLKLNISEVEEIKRWFFLNGVFEDNFLVNKETYIKIQEYLEKNYKKIGSKIVKKGKE